MGHFGLPNVRRNSGNISLPDMDEVAPQIEQLLVWARDIDPENFARGLGVPHEAVARYALQGNPGIKKIDRTLRQRAREKDGGKFNKATAHYVPQTPLPVGVWEYKCHTCRYYVEPEESPSGRPQCEIVGQEHNLFGGENIHPDAWCALWLPEDGREWFEWATDRLEGV